MDAEEEGWREKEARNQRGEGLRGTRETRLLRPHMFVHTHTYMRALTCAQSTHMVYSYDMYTSTCAHTTVHRCTHTCVSIHMSNAHDTSTQHMCMHRDTHVSTHAHMCILTPPRPQLAWPHPPTLSHGLSHTV